MTDFCRLYHTKVTQRTPSSTTITRSVRPADVVPFLLLLRLNQLTRAFVFRLSPHSVHTHFTRVHLLCIKSSFVKNYQEIVHQSPATNPLALDSTCNKGSESMQTLSSSVCAACTIPKKVRQTNYSPTKPALNSGTGTHITQSYSLIQQRSGARLNQ